ncbi:unnamed protein product [Phytophthora lilii]|uniref:Unnamed protein product n=1 Tax=Phytophthora lilii TaxID=2077276 RepID=A0A9W6TIM7_9STRA|nr:unnamed protein product [Phytophthora lilii]
MDSYAIYSRRIKALNQGSQAKFFVMPLSACIEQGTMVRICGFELFKEEKDVTETEWRDYFLSARVPDNKAYKTLDREVKSLCVDTDAESRISRLMAEFYEIIDRLNMEDVVHTEPKKVVGYLVDALRPHSFKAAQQNQAKKKNEELEDRKEWVKQIVPMNSRAKATVSKSRRTQVIDDRRSVLNAVIKLMASFNALMLRVQQRQKSFMKQLLEKKILKPVLAVAQPKNATPRSTTTISCVVMDTLETEITPDSAAEVSMVTTKLLNQLVAEGTWIKNTKRLSEKLKSPVLEKNLCRSRCGLPPGVGDLLLSRWIMERLGYSPEKLLAAAQQVRAEWDMSDVDDRSASGIASILAYSGASQTPVITEEERREEIRIILLEQVDKSQRVGATAEFCEELKTILMKLINVFRIIIGRDPPVDMPPMEVTLKPGAVPVRCKARRYSPVHRAFLKKHIDALISAGLCYRNPPHRLSSTCLTSIFNNGLIICIDDLLGYTDSDEGLLELLKKVLTICQTKGLKLNPKKGKFYLREALWCGRVVSGEGVRHDPARISALSNLPAPATGQELQQFVCALNWMRSSLPAFNKLIGPLVKMMEKVYERAGGRKKTQVRKVTLSDVGWGEAEVASLENCKQSLQNALRLAHPDPEKLLSVFTDASDEHWGAAITQIPSDQAARPLSEQEHQPLMMLSGSFSGAAKRWAIVEKEAYAIVETCRRADFLLHRQDGFALITDHRNLRFIFDPHSVSNSVPKYTADKLHRWSLLLMGS